MLEGEGKVCMQKGCHSARRECTEGKVKNRNEFKEAKEESRSVRQVQALSRGACLLEQLIAGVRDRTKRKKQVLEL